MTRGNDPLTQPSAEKPSHLSRVSASQIAGQPNRQPRPNAVSSVPIAQGTSDRILALAQPRRQTTKSYQGGGTETSPHQMLAVAKARGLLTQKHIRKASTLVELKAEKERTKVQNAHQLEKSARGDQEQSKGPIGRFLPKATGFVASTRLPHTQSDVGAMSDKNVKAKACESVPALRLLTPTVHRIPPKVTQEKPSVVEPSRGPQNSKPALVTPKDLPPPVNLETTDKIVEQSVKEPSVDIAPSPSDTDSPLSVSPVMVTQSLTEFTPVAPSQPTRLQDVKFAAEPVLPVAETNQETESDSDSEEDPDDSPPTVKPVTRKSETAADCQANNKGLPVLKYHTDQGFRPLLCAFRNLQWRDFANRGRWHMFWANVANARALFQPGQRYYFNDDQLVNHYQTCYYLSRKDNMTKNIKKFRTEMAHLKDPIGRKDKHGNFVYLDLIAPTYLLPFDFNTFVVDFKKYGGLYIVKPCSGSQGQGIFLINQLDQAKRWQERVLAEIAACVQENEGYQGYLISRYISNPLLIDGKKFDLRLYILVTSFKPLRCYYYRQGFCRFCATRYNPDVGSIDDKFMHLTNVAVQKQKKGYNRSHGNKWSITAFRLYMERVYGRGKIDALFDRIFWMIVQSLRSVQSLMDNDRHCYEMYGYDCLIDAHLKPWLLEINASPSLENTTTVDRVIKTNLLIDTMRMAFYERCSHLIGIKEKRRDGSDMPLGDYEVLYLEEPAPKLTPAERVKKANQGRYGAATGPASRTSLPVAGQDKPRWNSL